MKETSLFINLKNLTNNIDIIKSLPLVKSKTIIAIVKSDAYGHGIEKICGVIAESGINFFGTIKISEAATILENNSEAKILMLSGVEECDLKDALRRCLRIAVFDLDYLNLVLSKAKESNKKAIIHIKYDSGMNRLGFDDKNLKKAVELIKKNSNLLDIEGFFSHLSSGGDDIEYTNFQIQNFRKMQELLNKNGLEPKLKHISASSAIFNDKITEDFSNAVRPGVSLYGINPNSPVNIISNHDSDVKSKISKKDKLLKPIMSLESSIIQIKSIKKGAFVSYNKTFKASKNMTVAVLNAGYDNGIPRLLSNCGRALINGHFAPIIGIVTMNMIIVDITDIKDVCKDDKAIIIGRSPNGNGISTDEIAKQAKTISYEILLNIGKSNAKKYI